MSNTIINAIKKLFFALFETNLLAIVFRLVLVLVISFFIIPKFYPNFQGLRIKMEFCILSAILLEILASKLKSISMYSQVAENKQGTLSFFEFLSSGSTSKRLPETLKKQPCFLLLHGSGMHIENVLLPNNYEDTNSFFPADLNNKFIKVSSNYNNTITSCTLENFKKIVLDPTFTHLRNQLVKVLKKNTIPSVTLVIEVKDLIALNDKSELLQNFYCCMQFLNKHLGNNFNFNLLIDKVVKLKGFDEILEINKKLEEELNLSFMTDITDYELTLNQFNSSFTSFVQSLRIKLFKTRIEKIAIHQAVYIFTQQISFLRKNLLNLLESIIIHDGRRRFFFQRENKVLVTINFINSITTNTEKGQKKLPAMLEEFEQYIQKT